MDNSERHCEQCRHSVLYLGGLDEDFKARENICECVNNKVCYHLLDEHDWDPAKMPEVCEEYQQRLMRECGVCGDKMNIPEQNWPIWADCIIKEVPCCSKDCKKKLEQDVMDTLKANFK